MASHTDSVCTASQCWNCVDTVEKSRTITKRPPWITTSATAGFLSWLLSIFRLRYWWYCVVKSRPRPLQPMDSSPGYFDTSAFTFLWLSVPLLVAPPQQHRHHLPACHRHHHHQLPPPHLPPATPLSLSSLFFPSSLQDPCLYHYHDHHHHDKCHHHDNHHCHRQPVATFLFLMNSNRQDVFVCVKLLATKI